MKRDAGWATALVAIATAVGLSTSTNTRYSSDVPVVGHTAAVLSPNAHPTRPFYKGPCHELNVLLGSFLNIDRDRLPTPDDICRADASPAPTPIITSPAARPTVHFIIATLPDPLHTHFSLAFDRYTEAIQQAAQDSHYTYESSWLPWEMDVDQHLLVSDQDRADSRKERREDQPGLLLFRRSWDCDASDNCISNKYSPAATPTSTPYQDAVFVFVVGEEPTGGIHREQFKNAVRWISTLSSSLVKNDSLKLLGPTFSGSLPSLHQLLIAPEIRSVLFARPPLQIDGVTSSMTTVKWFLKATIDSHLDLQYQSFRQDDDAASDRYIRYLDKNNFNTCHLAIISEDETAYGYRAVAPSESLNSTRCDDLLLSKRKPSTFYYPRDISAVRAAYQEQSVFDKSSNSSSDPTRHTLRSDLADPEGKQHDTIRSYGGSQTALSEEAALLQIVSMLRDHHVEFLLLRASNPLDLVFLAHFFKLTYPQGRVVVSGADLLLRRDLGDSGLSGTMTLSTYPLLPQIDDWTKPSAQANGSHSHRPFTQEGAQGIYIALRFLLGPNHPAGKSPENVDNVFLPPLAKDSPYIVDYSSPFWRVESGQPFTWLSVLGSDGFWPVAAFGPPNAQLEPRFTRVEALVAPFLLFTHPPPSNWPKVPLSMNLALAAVILWAIFHLLCCCRSSITIKPDHRSYFVRIKRVFPAHASDRHPRTHLVLIIASSALVLTLSTILAWGFGWLSGEPPIHNARIYSLVPVFVWILCGCSVFGNSFIEHYCHDENAPKPSFKTLFLRGDDAARRFRGAAFRATVLPLLAFTVLTLGIYCLLVLYLDWSSLRNHQLLYFRSMYLANGVSPVVPYALLTLGLYAWCWYSLRGLAVFGADRPLLPSKEHLFATVGGKKMHLFAPLERDRAGVPLEHLSRPFNLATRIAFSICFVLLLSGSRFAFGPMPLRSLGTGNSSRLLFVWICASISLLIANAWQLLHVWIKLRSVLVFLDRLPLRRTLQIMRGLTWRSLWDMGGNVLDVRYKLFYRQFESMNHLQLAFAEYAAKPGLPDDRKLWAKRWWDTIEATVPDRIAFATWYSDNWDYWAARNQLALQGVQESTSVVAGKLLADVLIPAWQQETDSMLILPAADGDADEREERRMLERFDRLPPYHRHAEEFVCLLFIAFTQNILCRIRSLILGMVALFLSIAFVLPSYPLDPRPVLTGAVMILFTIIAGVIFTVYTQMFRDATLSNMTNTRPGELGIEFWIKFVSVGIAPVCGLLATLFPGLNDFFFSWIQPNLSSVK